MHLIERLRRYAEVPTATDEWQKLHAQLGTMQMAVHAQFVFTDDEETKIVAAAAIARLEPSQAGLVLPALIGGLNSKQESLVVCSCVGLRAIGPLAASAVPVLTTLLTDDNEVVVQHAIQALEAIGPASASATSALITLLQGTGPDSLAIQVAHAWAAAAALAAIGPGAREAIPTLKNCLVLEANRDELVETLVAEVAMALAKISD